MKDKQIKIGEGISQKFSIGSNYFFGCYHDFVPKDYDYLYFVDTPIMFRNVLNIRSEKNGVKEDIFYWKKKSPEEYVCGLLQTGNPMQAGKFLVKEVCDCIGFTIDNLKEIKSVFENMDSAHEYEKWIYIAYIKNNDFFLTDEQREKAYNIYKQNKIKV